MRQRRPEKFGGADDPAKASEPVVGERSAAPAAGATAALSGPGEPAVKAKPADPFVRAENEDDDGYDPYSDRPAPREPMFERDPWG